jgi:rod shape-determining protein MreB
MSSISLGIDMGTCNLKVYEKSKDTMYSEKNVIAIENGTRLYAFGDDAFDMYEKAPDSINVSFPIQNGVIADFRNMQTIMTSFVNRHIKGKLKNCEVIVAVPTDITEVEKRAFYDLIAGSTIHTQNIFVCEKPIAAAVGLGLPVNTATGMLIVDIGADTTEISVLSLGGIVLSRLIKVGGNKMDENIIASVKKNHNLIIGRKTANALLREIGYAYQPQEAVMSVVGRDVVTGLPTSVEINSKLVYDAIKELFDQIVDAIKFILERTPPELTSDIIDNGMHLTGGVANIRNIARLFAKETELEVKVSQNPEDDVVVGLNRVASDNELKYIAYSFKGRGGK